MPEYSVLVVEDDEIIARILTSMLRDSGYITHTPVNSGEQALEQVAVEKPDIVLMDIDLAGAISGITAAKEIFNIFSIPVIFVTGHDERKFLEMAMGSMPFGFLVKPVNPNLLYSTIQVAINLCERIRVTTEGKKAGLSPLMSIQVSDSSHPVIILNSDNAILWMNQAAEECVGENGSALFLKDIRQALSLLCPDVNIQPDFFRSYDAQDLKICSDDIHKRRSYKITARPVVNMFGSYSGSFITITSQL
ncbi:MAG: two-component response regulator [Euryarchaeota archaeon ADurb.Bin294]|jgi:CheY-like chemotaxis protein|nr:response regulator [Methanomicrobiales archaeon]OQA51682.1 MAG: two-component response regulator [Euryarchaeota archaeon ADurb.Bin294]